MEPLIVERYCSIFRCARCGKDHPNLGFHKFTEPSGPNTHFAMCPENGQPILMRVVSDDEAET